MTYGPQPGQPGWTPPAQSGYPPAAQPQQYGQPQYGPQQYGQPQYGQQYGPTAPYGQPPGYPRPKRSPTPMIAGIVAILAAVFVGINLIFLFAGPHHFNSARIVTLTALPIIKIILLVIGAILLLGRKPAGRILVIIAFALDVIGLILGAARVVPLYVYADYYLVFWMSHGGFGSLGRYEFSQLIMIILELVAAILALLPMSGRPRAIPPQQFGPPQQGGYPGQQPGYPQPQGSYPQQPASYPQQQPSYPPPQPPAPPQPPPPTS